MATYRVIVTGSREWTDKDTLYAALDAALAQYRSLVVVHGGARGADTLAEMWVAEQAGLTGTSVFAEEVRADWHSYGKRAGFIRNAAMISRGADLCLAFYKQGAGNRGTDHCARLAASAGIPVRRFYQDG